MWKFNLVVTMAADARFRRLLEDLSRHGDFHKTEFFGVILGAVADPAEFLALVEDKRSHQPPVFQDVGRVIPLVTCLVFTLETFEEQLRAALAPYVARLINQRFYVRLERRGLKGAIISPEIERSLDAFVLERVARAGGAAEVDFDDPDTVLAVETFGNRCGIGLLTREMRDRYPFTRVS